LTLNPQISLAMWDGQLPTVILFEHGRPVLQVPSPAAAAKKKRSLRKVRGRA